MRSASQAVKPAKSAEVLTFGKADMLKIILADNQAIFRAGAAKVLAVEEDLRVVAQAENAEKLNAALSSFRAGLVIFAEGLNCDVRLVMESAKKQKTRVVAVADNADS